MNQRVKWSVYQNVIMVIESDLIVNIGLIKTNGQKLNKSRVRNKNSKFDPNLSRVDKIIRRLEQIISDYGHF